MLKNEKYKGDTLLQKTYTEDFMTGKKVKNIGQRDRYYIRNSHPAIVSAEIFDKVQEEMARRARLVHKEDGTVVPSAGKYNRKYLLGNLLVCGDCGASYRRRTERGKVVWRCATRIENGKESCNTSPTLNEEWIKRVLRESICCNGEFQEDKVRMKVENIGVHEKDIIIYCKSGSKIKINIE